MPSKTDRTAGELDWPSWAERTDAHRRETTHKFQKTLHSTIDDIEHELEERLDVDDWRLSTAAPHRKRDGKPYADASPDDPGVVVRWTKDGDQYAVPCDHYTTLRDNARAIYLYLKEKRKMEARPVRTIESEFATARLPPGDEEHAIAAEPAAPRLSDEEAAELLGVTPDAPNRVVEVSYQEAVKSEHPDRGGAGDVDRLQAARDQLLDNG